MATIKVELYGYYTRLAGKDREQIEIEEDVTVKGLLLKMKGCWNRKFIDTVLDMQSNSLRVPVFVNSRNISYLQGMETRLKDGDVVAFLPPQAGG